MKCGGNVPPSFNNIDFACQSVLEAFQNGNTDGIPEFILIKNGKSVSEAIAYRDDVFDYIQHTKLWKIHVELFMPGVVFLMK